MTDLTTDCYPSPTNGAPLLTVVEARAAILAAADPVARVTQRIVCADSLGRVLAESIRSPIDVPPHDNSAMDGYALRADDLGADWRLPIAQRIAAGESPPPLPPGTAARIFTGAPIPDGADTVVIQEECEIASGWLRLRRAPQRGGNIRPRGNDIAAGQEVLAAGTRLDPRHLGLLASIGHREVSVRPRLRVALLTTGAELTEPGEPLAPGRIYNSNRHLLAALLREQGCELIDPGPVPDTLEATQAALRAAAATADLIVSTGGVSVGDEDHVKAAVAACGQIALWRVNMKPGKPLLYGRIQAAHLIGLPGNPVSAYVTALLFLLPLLRRLQGRDGPLFPEPESARLAHDWPRARPRREFLRARLVYEAGQLPWAEPAQRQGSDVLTGVAHADGLLELPPDATPKRGTIVNYWSLARLQA
ncbi:gephyrin-like molybdotransferase Glp [uncultured Thiodictyon sp.]|uniref:molybdopterin molybdotransferase MoeA n=1 Tax=uncultured Thiodictyon sp. TaxID=1846217 RepID=UPI0025D5060B|nr:gephyrin-like molybdotransferase Glp [uncultured Thiodictyon sp.]